MLPRAERQVDAALGCHYSASQIFSGVTASKILDEQQPVVNHLLRGKITQMSIEKLLVYPDCLGLSSDLQRPHRRVRRRRAA